MKRLLFLFFFIGLAAQVCSAQIPRTIPYQGLLQSGGAPVADGNYQVVISLYTATAGGALLLYSETQNVNTSNGLFSVIIGSVTPIPASLTFDSVYYIGVAINGNPEESPRAAFSSVPYALHAAVASSLSPDAKIPNGLFSLSSTPGGPASGDLRGNYPAPRVVGFRSQTVTADTPHYGDGLMWKGKSWALHSFTKPVAFLAAGDTTMLITDSTSGKIILIADSTNGSVEDSGYINLNSDVFTAPDKGAYGFMGSFAISAVKTGLDSTLYFSVGLLVSGTTIALQTLTHPISSKVFTLNYSTTANLKAGDKVTLFIKRPPQFQPPNFYGIKGTIIVKSSEFAGYKIN